MRKMKHKGSAMEYAQERMNEIMRAYNEYVCSCKHINIPYICKKIAEMPASRFWVSEIWASKIILAMMQNKHPYYNMRPLKKEMFLEIHKRVIEIKRQNPQFSIKKCCTIVVEQPAPKHYLSPTSIQVMICKEKKRLFQERKKRLQHCF